MRSIDSAKKATVPINHVFAVDRKDVETTETKLVAFLVENDLAFSLIEKLVPLVKSLSNMRFFAKDSSRRSLSMRQLMSVW